MLNPILVLLVAQGLYTASDLMARYYMGAYGFTLHNFLSPWFLVYFILRTAAMFGTLYLFTLFDLGKNVGLFAAVSIILGNVLGYLLLGEVLAPVQYVGVMLAIAAVLTLILVK